MQAHLRSVDPDRRSHAFEELVVRAFHVERETEDEALSLAYVALSDALLKRKQGDRSGSFKRGINRGFDDRHVDIVWALIYGARTFYRARDLLTEFPSRPGRCLEIGSGWGPFGLAAALDGHQVELIEPTATDWSSTHQLYDAAGLPRPRTRSIPADPPMSAPPSKRISS